MVAASRRRNSDVPSVVETFHATSTNIRALNIHSDHTFVNEDANATAVWVTVTSTSTRMTDVVSFSERSTNGQDSLTIMASSYPGDIEYLIDVFVPSQSIQSVAFGGSGSLVVNPRSLVSTVAESAIIPASVSISSSGSGDVYVQDTAVELHSLALSAMGSGELQWDVPVTHVATSVDVRNSGSGGVSMFSSSSLLAGTLVVKNYGSGDIVVTSANVTMSLNVATTIAGSGDVSYDSTGLGYCRHLDMNGLGSGDAHMSSIACESTKVFSAGSGDVYVTSTHDLQVNRMGSATVYVTRPAPPGASGKFELMGHPSINDIPSKEAVPPHEMGSGGLEYGFDHVGGGIGILGQVVVLLLVLFGLVRCCRRWWCCGGKDTSETNKLDTIALQSQQHAYYHGAPLGNANNRSVQYYQGTASTTSSSTNHPPHQSAYAYYPNQTQPQPANYSGTISYTQYQPSYAAGAAQPSAFGGSTDRLYAHNTYQQQQLPSAPSYPSSH
ncbi:hypothetical protein B5M09_013433 [Aphanomyces astaci]|uniref:Putative auto-transporter adhesin head GIN domain-containing protein n=1 Tax=Aphanomyces astaci TaxID=112090 RepID=A0A3R7WKW2_APHAT|nr:hypothetical protein B5M09_013433 [Aphanomyces astaci]